MCQLLVSEFGSCIAKNDRVAVMLASCESTISRRKTKSSSDISMSLSSTSESILQY